MTDRELLELAAKAAGIDAEWFRGCSSLLLRGSTVAEGGLWNPLTDDGDALRLANKLQLTVQIGRLDGTVVVTSNNDNRVYVAVVWSCGESNDKATRTAIVRAAAEIGKGTHD